MKKVLCAILCWTLLLSPLAKAQDIPPAPESDRATLQTFNAIVYYWSEDQSRLEAIPREITVAEGMNRIEALLQTLLAEPLEESLQNLTSPLPDNTELLSLEESRGIATVNLSAGFLQLETEEQYIARVAITNTLTATTDIHHVVVLVDGYETGILDMPVGAWEQRSVDYSAGFQALRAEAEMLRVSNNGGYRPTIQRDAVLYFPARNGDDYLLPEARNNIRFDPQNIARDLLRELIIGPSDAEAMRMVLPANAMVNETPVLLQGDEGLTLTIPLPADFYEALEANKIAEEQAFAAMVLTMFSFIPGLDYVRFLHQNDSVRSVGDDSDALDFADGRMRRRDFESMIGQNITLYARGGRPNSLRRVVRTVSQQAATRPRTLLRELISLSEEDERVFPHGAVNENILGIAIDGDQALVNISAQLQMLLQGVSMENERLLIYAIVNTLTELSSVKRVRFYVEGAEVDSLGGHLYMRGVFLRNTGMVR